MIEAKKNPLEQVNHILFVRQFTSLLVKQKLPDHGL